MSDEKTPYFYTCNYESEYKKIFDKARLKKEASGLGFYVFAFALSMTAIYMVLASVVFVFDESVLETTSIPFYFLEIFCSVFAAFIPGLIYLSASNKRITDVIEVKHVNAGLLVPIVLIGLAAAMIANAAANIVMQNFSLLGLENTLEFDYSSNSLAANILSIVSTAVVPAFSEEFAFRGIIMGSLRKYGDAFAIVASSVMFAIMHGNIIQIPFAFIIGLICAYADCKTNSIIPSIIIHFLNNFYAVILDILYNSELLSESNYYAISYLIIAVFCALGILSFLVLIKKDKNFFKISDTASMPANSNFILTLKEKNYAFFSSAGIIACIVLFSLETVVNLGVMSA